MIKEVYFTMMQFMEMSGLKNVTLKVIQVDMRDTSCFTAMAK